MKTQGITKVIAIQSFMAIHSDCFWIFQSGSMWWPDNLTDIAVPEATPAAWLKKHVTILKVCLKYSAPVPQEAKPIRNTKGKQGFIDFSILNKPCGVNE